MAEFNETVIDHVGGIGSSDDWCGVSTGEMALKNTLEKLAEEFPDEVECIAKNSDGSVYYHIPWKWVKIKRIKEPSEEEAERRRQMVREFNAKRWSKSIEVTESK